MSVAHHQRKSERAPFRGTVALCRQRTPRLVATENIGTDGIFLRVDEQLTERSLVTLRINVPGETGFTVMGRVIHRDDELSGVGVEFLDILPRDRARIHAYLTRARNSDVERAG
ncbi:MAG: PilZ domain-containing protein [Myxococcota bacterium]